MVESRRADFIVENKVCVELKTRLQLEDGHTSTKLKTTPKPMISQKDC